MDQAQSIGERTEVTRWWQAIKGKLVREPNGRVYTDYKWTGMTTGTPEAVLSECSPVKMMGFNDQSRLTPHPWLESHGALSVGPIEVEGKRYVVACRIKLRLECPKTSDDRRYSQAVYLIMPVSQFRDLSLVGLPTRLRAEPMTAIDLDLTHFDLPCSEDIELPDRWLESVQGYLQALLCGCSVGVDEPENGPDEFFRKILICLGCLPATIRWRLTVGAGLYRCNEHVLGQAMTFDGDVVVKNGRLDLREDQKVKSAAYVHQLREHCSGLRSLSALHQQIARMFPKLHAWNAIPEPLTWREAMRALGELDLVSKMEEHLKSYGASQPPSLRTFVYFRRQVIDAVVAAVAGSVLGTIRSEHVLEGMVKEPEWEDDLRKTFADAADEKAKLLGMLLGYTALDPDLILRCNLKIPKSMHDTVARRLNESLAAVQDEVAFDQWREVIKNSAIAGAPDWLEHWRKDEECLLTILWKVYEGGILDCLRPLARWDKRAGVLFNVAHESLFNYDDLEHMARMITPAYLVQAIRLLGMIKASDPVYALLLKQRWEDDLGKPIDFAVHLQPSDLVELPAEERRKLAAKIGAAADKVGLCESVLQPLLTLWSHLPGDLADRLRRSVRRSLPDDLAEILLGPLAAGKGIAARREDDTLSRVLGPDESGRAREPALSRPATVDILRNVIAVERVVADRALAKCRERFCRDDIVHSVSNWVFRLSDPKDEMPISLIQSVRTLNDGEFTQTSFPTFDAPEDAMLAAKLLSPKSPFRNVAFHPPIDSLSKFRAYLAAFRPMYVHLITEGVWIEALEKAWTSPADREYFEERLRKLGLWERHKWRLLRANVEEHEVFPEELAMMSGISGLAFVRLACARWPVPESHLGRITPDVIRGAFTPAHHYSCFETLLDLAQRMDRKDLARNVLLCIVDTCRNAEWGELVAQDWRREFDRGLLRSTIRVFSDPRVASQWSILLIRAAKASKLDRRGVDSISACFERRDQPVEWSVAQTKGNPSLSSPDNWPGSLIGSPAVQVEMAWVQPELKVKPAQVETVRDPVDSRDTDLELAAPASSEHARPDRGAHDQNQQGPNRHWGVGARSGYAERVTRVRLRYAKDLDGFFPEEFNGVQVELKFRDTQEKTAPAFTTREGIASVIHRSDGVADVYVNEINRAWVCIPDRDRASPSEPITAWVRPY